MPVLASSVSCSSRWVISGEWRSSLRMEEGTTVAGPAQLGSYLQDGSGETAEGIWIRLDEIPVSRSLAGPDHLVGARVTPLQAGC